jgi:hypothetical protein
MSYKIYQQHILNTVNNMPDALLLDDYLWWQVTYHLRYNAS